MDPLQTEDTQILQELYNLRLIQQQVLQEKFRKTQLEQSVKNFQKQINNSQVLLKAILQQNQQDKKTISNLEQAVVNLGVSPSHIKTTSGPEIEGDLDSWRNELQFDDFLYGHPLTVRSNKRRATTKINTRECNTPEKFVSRRNSRSNTGGSHEALLKKPVKQTRKSLYKKFDSKTGGKFIPSFLRVKVSK